MKCLLRRGSLALILVVLAGVQGCGNSEEKLAGHLTRAEEAFENDEYAEAIIDYRNALQIDPKNAEAHYGFARSLLETGKIADSYWWLSETVRIDPRNWDARLEYGKLALAVQELEIALVQAEAVIEGAPERAEAYALKAQVLEALERNDEALQFYQTAIRLGPEMASYPRYLANFYVRAGNVKEAERYLRDTIELEPTMSAYHVLALFLMEIKDATRLEDSEVAFRQALSVADPEDPEEVSTAYRLLVNFYIRYERFEEAEAILLRGVEEEPDNLAVIYLLADFYVLRDEKEKATVWVEAATRVNPDDSYPFMRLSVYREAMGQKQGDFDGALAAVQDGLKIDPASEKVRLRYAELLLKKGFREDSPELVAEGRAIADAVLEEDSLSAGALYLKAWADYKENDLEAASLNSRRALEVRPDWANAQFILGATLYDQGDLQGARAELIGAATLIEARKLLVRVHYELGEVEFAIEEGKLALQQAPQDPALRVVIANALLGIGKRKEAIELLLELPESKHNAKSFYLLGRSLMKSGDMEQGRLYVERADRLEPYDARILETLFRTDPSRDRIEKSKKRVAEAIAAKPDDAGLFYLRGLLSLFSGDAASAESDFRRSIQLEPNDMSAYQMLEVALDRMGQSQQEMIEVYEESIENSPDEAANRHLMLGMLYGSSGRQAKAIEHYEQAVELDPNLAVAKNNLAFQLAETGGDIDRALELAQAAKERLPNDPIVADTLGWVLYKKGLASAAIIYFSEAVANPPEDRSTEGRMRYHLALAYDANEQPDRALEVLREVLEPIDERRRAQELKGAQPAADPEWVAQARELSKRLEASR